MIRAAIVLLLASVAAGCASPAATADPFGNLAAGQGITRDLPPNAPPEQGRPGPGGGTLLRSTSSPIASGQPYRFTLGHCGLASPVDVDGSFWEAVAGETDAGQPVDLDIDIEMINATTGTIIVIGDEARFRTESGSVIRFERAGIEREFPGCD